MSIQVRPNIVTNGLVFHLDAANTKSYPKTGTTWTDLSGNKNNGTLTNGPVFSSTNGGNIVFDGVDDYISGISLQITGDFTILYIVYSLDIATQLIYYPFGFSISPGVGGSFFGGNLAPYASKVGIFDGSSQVISNQSIAANKWYIITISRNSTTASVYINGIFDTSGTISSNSVSNFRLGTRSDNIWWYKGNISLAQIYNRALSAQEVLQNYNATKTRFGLT